MKLFLDDIRFPPEPGWSIVRSVDDFYYLWGKNKDEITDISFDFDMGSGVDTGYDALKLVEHDILTGAVAHPINLLVHSMNPVGAEKMRETIQRMKERG